MFPAKKKCLNVLYDMTAWTYIDQRNLKFIKNEEQKISHLKRHLGLQMGKLPRDIDIGWIPTPNKKQAMKKFRKKLAMASEPLELSWFYHEFSKLLMEICRFDLARFYAKKARDISNEAKSEHWILNANHILIRIEIGQHNRNEAREAALLALLSAKKIGIRYIIDFYKRVIRLIDEMDFEQLISVDSITAREQLICNLMPEDLKTNVDFLFRTMNAIPPHRRMSVMPGCKPLDKKFKLPCKRNTIRPDPPKNPAKDARAALLQQYAPTKTLGWLDFQQYE